MLGIRISAHSTVSQTVRQPNVSETYVCHLIHTDTVPATRTALRHFIGPDDLMSLRQFLETIQVSR